MRIVKIFAGLGNQLFQYSFYYKTIRNTGKCFVDLGWFTDRNKSAWYPYQLDKLGLEVNIIERNEYCVKDFYIKNHDISEEEFEVISHGLGVPIVKLQKEDSCYGYYPYWEIDDSYYQGFFQNIEYFYDVIDDIRNSIKFPNRKDCIFQDMRESILSDENSVSLHIRLNDFPDQPLREGFEEACGVAYYRSAIDIIMENNPQSRFYVFSNNINKAKTIFNDLNMVFVDINDRFNGIGDLELMSLCRHNIIPNSTFGWWGAVLNRNKDKIVIAPDRFDVRFPGIDPNKINLFFDDWIRV